jgi:integrase/recombinase XerD
VTHLRQIMLEELERRNYAPSTIRAYIPRSSTLPGTFTVHPTGLARNTFGSIRQPCFGYGSWLRTPSHRLAALRFLYIQVLKRGWSVAETPIRRRFFIFQRSSVSRV